MRLLSYNGLMGTGKTLNLVDNCIKHYKKINLKYQLLDIIYYLTPPSKLKDKLKIYHDYRNMFYKKKVNNIYSNFPILLNYKHKIYSNKVTIDDLNTTFSFLPESYICIDEIQLGYDSDEYKDKIVNFQLSKIGKFINAHRHFGIDTIILAAQSPARIFKKGREVCSWYVKHKGRYYFPFWIVMILLFIIYYFFNINDFLVVFLVNFLYWFSKNYSFLSLVYYADYDYYGEHIPKSKEERKKLRFDFKTQLKLIKHSNLYKCYDSRYLALYNFNKPLLKRGTWTSLKVDYNYVKNMFEIDKDRIIQSDDQLKNIAHEIRKEIFNKI